MSGNLERRYRRVLRLLPGWYRERWEQDMVAAFLDSWLTGDPEADEYITRAAGPSWAEAASVARLAVRLHLGGAGTARRGFAWGQAIRCAVLVRDAGPGGAGPGTCWCRRPGVAICSAGSRRRPRAWWWRRTPPGIVPPVVWYLVACAWIAGLRVAGPGALPDGPGHRGAGHRPLPDLGAAGPVRRPLPGHRPSGRGPSGSCLTWLRSWP